MLTFVLIYLLVGCSLGAYITSLLLKRDDWDKVFADAGLPQMTMLPPPWIVGVVYLGAVMDWPMVALNRVKQWLSR